MDKTLVLHLQHLSRPRHLIKHPLSDGPGSYTQNTANAQPRSQAFSSQRLLLASNKCWDEKKLQQAVIHTCRSLPRSRNILLAAVILYQFSSQPTLLRTWADDGLMPLYHKSYLYLYLSIYIYLSIYLSIYIQLCVPTSITN